MNVHLINPSTVSFGTAVITPRWQYVLAGATPKTFGDPILVDETLCQIEARDFVQARWDLIPRDRYMWASVQTVRGCPKHCSFCSVWRTDGQRPRQRSSDVVIEEIVQLRRLGFRFIALADDNFYPVTITDLRLATQQNNTARLNELKALRAERFELMERLSKLPDDMVL